MPPFSFMDFLLASWGYVRGHGPTLLFLLICLGIFLLLGWIDRQQAALAVLDEDARARKRQRERDKFLATIAEREERP